MVEVEGSGRPSKLEIFRDRLQEVRDRLICVHFEMEHNPEREAFLDTFEDLIEEQYPVVKSIARFKKKNKIPLRNLPQEEKVIKRGGELNKILGGSCEEGEKFTSELVDMVVAMQRNLGVRE